MAPRRRVRQSSTLDERLAKHADQLRIEARALPRIERERVLKKARQFDVAIHINDCLTSPAMQQATLTPEGRPSARSAASKIGT